MIFVVLGTQKFQLNRLLRLLDDCVSNGLIHDEIVVQTGFSDFELRHLRCYRFLEKSDFEAYVKASDVVISHGGIGSIMTALQNEKPVIVFPRLSKYNEHVDDHQTEIARVFAEKEYVLSCGETDDLPSLLEKSKAYSFNKYISQTDRIVKLIDGFLQGQIVGKQ